MSREVALAIGIAAAKKLPYLSGAVNITQILFFKFKDAKASFRANGAKVSINHASLIDLGPAIRSKVRAYQTDYLSTILDL